MGQFVVPVGTTAGITRYRTGGPTLVEDAQRNPCFVIADGRPGQSEAEALRPGPAQSGGVVSAALHVASRHADNLDEIEMDLQAIAALELAEAPLAETHARFTAC
jgi:hypothetical protein